MKLENQLTSIEISLKLKELRVPQQSLFYWVHQNGSWKIHYADNKDIGNQINVCSAYTVAELGNLLPANVNIIKPILYCGIKNKNMWNCRYGNTVKSIYADYEVNARSQMLIYLIEKECIKFGDL